VLKNSDLRDLLMPAAQGPMHDRRTDRRAGDRQERRAHHAVYCYMEEADRQTLRRARRKRAEDRSKEETRVFRLYKRLQRQMQRAGQDRDYRHNPAFRQWLVENGHDPAAPHSQDLYKRWLRQLKEQEQ
jgi:hypothetical protein